MTLAQAVAQLSQKATLEQSVFSGTDSGTAWSISNDAATDLINESMRRIAVRARLRDPDVLFTLTDGEKSYTLNSSSVVGADVWRPMKVIIDGKPLLNASFNDYGMWTLEEFEAMRPKWRTDTTAGVPTVACYMGHSLGEGSSAGGAKVVLWPAPSSAVAALTTHFIDGYVKPHPLVYSTDSAKELKITADLHPFIVDLALIIGETVNASEAEHWNRLDRMHNGVLDQVSWFATEEERAFASWGSTVNSVNRDEVFW